MKSESQLPSQAHIRQIRLFFSGSPQVALYGSPSTVGDGWITNLPAAEVFAGDFSGLLYERLIDAQEAHERTPFHKTFYERHVRQVPQPRWPQQAPPAPASPDQELVRVALRHLNTARVLASRLAQQARRDQRPEDEQSWLGTAADCALKTADHLGESEPATKLRVEALRILHTCINLSSALAEHALRDNRPHDQYRFLAAAADSARKAADLQVDTAAADKLSKQAFTQFTTASTVATRLALHARRDNRPHDQYRFLAAAADSARKAVDLQDDAATAEKLRMQALTQFATASTIATRLALHARRDNRPQDEQRFLADAGDAACSASKLHQEEEAATLLNRQGLKKLKSASILAGRLSQKAGSEIRLRDQQIFAYEAANLFLVVTSEDQARRLTRLK